MPDSGNENCTQPRTIGHHPALANRELPLTTAGLESLLTEIVLEAVAGLLAPQDSTELPEWIAWAEMRMPAVFSPKSATRGAAIAAFQDIEEQVDGLSASACNWPPSPQWVAGVVGGVMSPLIDTFAKDMNVHLPGTVAFLDSMAKERLPKVFRKVDDGGVVDIRTSFKDRRGVDRQYRLRVVANGVLVETRERGETAFRRVAHFDHSGLPAIVALLRHYRAQLGGSP